MWKSPCKMPCHLVAQVIRNARRANRFARIIRNSKKKSNPYFLERVRPIRANHSNLRFARITRFARIMRIDSRKLPQKSMFWPFFNQFCPCPSWGRFPFRFPFFSIFFPAFGRFSRPYQPGMIPRKKAGPLSSRNEARK